MSQASFLDEVAQPPPVTRARATDPETSHEAAESMTPDVLRKLQRRVLATAIEIDRVEPDRGVTAHELAGRMAYDNEHAPPENSLVKRCRELEVIGLMRDTGDKRPGGSGRRQIVWAVTDDGREAVAVGPDTSEVVTDG